MDNTINDAVRPLGRQLAWLKLGGCDDLVHPRYDHADLKSRVGDAVHRARRQAARDAAIRQAETGAAMAEPLACESPSGVAVLEPVVVRCS